MKATAQVLGNSGLGSSYKATMSNGFAVVVKRTKEMNSIGKDEFDVMAKRLGKLKHPNVLTPLAYHYRVEEKLFVYDYIANGSLLYLLHGMRKLHIYLFAILYRHPWILMKNAYNFSR